MILNAGVRRLQNAKNTDSVRYFTLQILRCFKAGSFLSLQVSLESRDAFERFPAQPSAVSVCDQEVALGERGRGGRLLEEPTTMLFRGNAFSLQVSIQDVSQLLWSIKPFTTCQVRHLSPRWCGSRYHVLHLDLKKKKIFSSFF